MTFNQVSYFPNKFVRNSLSNIAEVVKPLRIGGFMGRLNKSTFHIYPYKESTFLKRKKRFYVSDILFHVVVCEVRRRLHH